MKLVLTVTPISTGAFAGSAEHLKIRRDIQDGITSVVWPLKAKTFTILPKRKANGVGPIKDEMMATLKSRGWELEKALDLATVKEPGELDAVLQTKYGPYALEWETGNISSSHRALNKMALGILLGKLSGGTLVVPSRNLYKYLTDRIGNYDEIAPYIPLWKALPCENGVLEILVVEHDATSDSVLPIPKQNDGMAAGAKVKAAAKTVAKTLKGKATKNPLKKKS